jgi:hypothetical protein
MFDSFGRGLKMIWSSIKMGLKDQRLLWPSILTVFTNFFFGFVLIYFSEQKIPGLASKTKELALSSGHMAHQSHHLLQHGVPKALEQLDPAKLINLGSLNGPFDINGLQAMGSNFGETLTSPTSLSIIAILSIWWLTNRFLEGVTTALTYSHLTDGPGSGRFLIACKAVLESLPAIVMLGIVTFIARNIAKFMRRRRGAGVFGFGINFIAGIFEVFWTLAGHLILPAIVIEGSSFVGALRRADRIASGNLLTIGIGEVGVDGICRLVTWLTYLLGVGLGGAAYYATAYNHVVLPSALLGFGVIAWGALAIVVTAFSIYIRAAFYTCLYVWAIESEAVAHAERVRVAPPGPLAAALA